MIQAGRQHIQGDLDEGRLNHTGCFSPKNHDTIVTEHMFDMQSDSAGIAGHGRRKTLTSTAIWIGTSHHHGR
jgi:hypothetical protein